MIIHTYIMHHNNTPDVYYVGKTNNIDRRMKEHKTDRRSNYSLIWSVEGNYEDSIKRFGVLRFIRCLMSEKPDPNGGV